MQSCPTVLRPRGLSSMNDASRRRAERQSSSLVGGLRLGGGFFRMGARTWTRSAVAEPRLQRQRVMLQLEKRARRRIDAVRADHLLQGRRRRGLRLDGHAAVDERAQQGLASLCGRLAEPGEVCLILCVEGVARDKGGPPTHSPTRVP